MIRGLPRGTAAAITGIAAAVLVLVRRSPAARIFLRVPLARWSTQLRSPVARDALRISLKTSLVALAFIVVVGTPVAHLLGTRRSGVAACHHVLELPLVLPPVVAGIGLFAAFGSMGLLGRSAPRAAGIQLPFTWMAVVMAQAFVAMPFYVRQASRPSRPSTRSSIGASRTLGAGPTRTFLRIEVPLARQSLTAGATPCWARALGEFGATALFAGNLPGTTQTLTLAIYAEFTDANLESALAMSALLVAVSFGVLVVIKMSSAGA